MNWFGAAPWLLSLALGTAGVTGYYIERGNYLMAKSTLTDEKAQEAKNIAAAEAAIRIAKDTDAAVTSKIITDLKATNDALQEQANAGETTVAAAPIVTPIAGCPDIMAAPVVRGFLGSLPPD